MEKNRRSDMISIRDASHARLKKDRQNSLGGNQINQD